MVDAIDPNANRPIEPVGPGGPAGIKGPTKTPDGKTFGDVLTESIQEVNRMQLETDDAIEKLASGKIKDLTELSEVVSAVEKADLAFSTLMQIRNRLVEAYQEIMRIRT